MPIRFDHPELLWLLLLAVPVVWLGRRSLAALDPGRRWAAMVLRLAVLTILVLMLAGVQSVRWHHDLTVVAVLDESESVRRLAAAPAEALLANPSQTPGGWARQWIADIAKDRKPDDRLGLITFDARPTVRAMPAGDITLESDTLEDPRAGTDTAAALRLGMALFPPDSGKRLLLIGDGNDLSPGQALAAAQEAAAAGVPIDVLPIEYRVDHEVMVDGVYAPTEAREGQTVAVRVVLRATRPTAGTLHLRHDGGWVDLSPGQDATGAAVAAADWSVQEPSGDEEDAGAAGRFVLVRLVQLPLTYSGANRFEAVFEPADEQRDTIVANNRAQSFTLVQGKGRVLVLNNVEGDGGLVLPRTLSASGIEVEVVSGQAMPGTLDELQRYDAVVLQNVPADMVTVAQQKMLAGYVRDLGGGFVMIGGPDSFGAGGWTNSPVDDILPVHCQIPAQTVLPVGALLLVIDRSGSMAMPAQASNESKQDVANEAAVLAISTLFPTDMLGVLAFSSGHQWVVPMGPHKDFDKTAKKVREISPGGGTEIYPALQEAHRAMSQLDAPNILIRHVILLTDGRGEGGDYEGAAQALASEGITLSTIGVGEDVDNDLLQKLADIGRGKYYPVTDARLLPRVFIKEARTVRKHLIKERPFMPKVLPSGSPITAGLNQTPGLRGLVLTGPKRDGRIFMPLVGPEGEPLFAHWQLGLGRTAAFTSDATNKWAAPWLSWNGYSDFWTRTLRTIARPAASRDFDLTSRVDGHHLHLRLDAAGDRSSGESFQNFLTVQGSLIRPDGSTQPVQLQQTGPGLYEARVPAADPGSYIVSLFASAPGGQRQFIFGGANQLPGGELRRMESNRALLEQIAQTTGGRVLSAGVAEPDLLFRRDSSVPRSRSIRPLWWPLMPWLLALLLLDVACRRVAWDAVASWRWVQARAAALRQALASREQHAAQTLEHLKQRAAQVKSGDTTSAPAASTERKAAAPAKPTSKPAAPAAARKFEAASGARASGDFAKAVGAAEKKPADKIKPAEPPPPTSDGPTTSRLLDAKRRARQKLDDQKDS